MGMGGWFEKRAIKWVLAAVMVSMLWASAPAGATGLGLYFTYGSGSADLDENWEDSSFFELSTEGDTDFFGGGFVLDTAVARDRVFNYRLNVGFENLEYEADSVFNESVGAPAIFQVYEFDINRIVLDHTFGFGIVRTEHFRMWIGPQLRIGGMWGDGDQASGAQRAEADLVGVVVGFAPVLGFNFHTPGSVSFGIDLGYRWTYMGGVIDKKLSSGNDDDDSFDFRETSFFVNFALLFRLGDDF
jgi:hypothetical protein